MGDGASGAGAGAAAVFDGMIKGWPEEGSVNIMNIPKEKKDFVLTIACDIYKNQKIENPREQAEESIQNALHLYNALKSKGYI